jgi:hypothetical protein
MKIASAVVGSNTKPLFNPQPDNIEKILLLISNITTPFPEEFSNLNLGLKLLGKMLQDMDTIQAQENVTN